MDLTKHPEPVNYVQPKVFRIGRPMIDYPQMEAYCKYTGQTAFLDDLAAARGNGVDESLCISSFFAKLCYRSLVTGKNDNISKIRSIPDNIQATFDAAHGCYDGETEVLTFEGWKAWPDVTGDERLATLDAVSGALVYRKPLRITAAPYQGRMYRVDAQGVDLLVTPNHNMYVCTTTTKAGRKRDAFSLISAEQLGTSAHAYIKTAEGWEPVGTGEFSRNVMRFIGFAIGDGHYPGGHVMRFHLRRVRKISWLRSLVESLIAESIIGGWSLRENGDYYAVTFPPHLQETLGNIYTAEKEKRIPPGLLTASTRYVLEGLLEGLMQSDGHEGRTGDSYDTTSDTLVGQIQQLCLHIGLAANVCYTIQPEDRSPTMFEMRHPLTRLSILGRNLRPEVNRHAGQVGKSSWIEDWSGDVYCAEMSDDTKHVLYVRRNGIPVWCGNSVFEHAWFNFVITDCSRILTHEAVRHRAGTAMSQTSGRYCRSDRLFFVTDPILEPVADSLDAALTVLQMGYLDLVDGMGFNGREGVERFVRDGNGSAKLNKMINGMEGDAYEAKIAEEVDRRMILLGDKPKSFDWKKKVTSALRRMLPNGQANELGFSLNIRALRHFILLRTAAGAEREIRDVAGQIYQLVKPIMPLAFAEAKEEMVDGLLEVRGLRMQPYERRCDD